MARGSGFVLHHLVILLSLFSTGNGIKTKVFLTPKIELEPGLVSNKFYLDIDFPRGHIALKSFDAEVIDEKGNPIPLHETYLHHWVVVRYHQRKGSTDIPKSHSYNRFLKSEHIIVKNSGLCDAGLIQYFGLGSETRRTRNLVPDPYGIEIGNPADIPDGYEEKWLINLHAIDTRGVEDKLGCIECRCDLYNVTVDVFGHALPSSYGGGLLCCNDETRCRLKDGIRDCKRNLYLKYKITYLDWDASIVPVNIYVLDVTDEWTEADAFRGTKAIHDCQIEYDVEACPAGELNRERCVDTRTLSVDFPDGGDVIYGVAHLHAGGLGAALFGEGGREICSSYPQYGTGQEAGNEDGYIVGMSTCYPSPGSVKISPGEKLTLVSNYSSTQKHVGVMAFFYLLIADSSARPNTPLQAPVQEHKSMMTSKICWAFAAFSVGVVFAAIFVMVRPKTRKGGQYVPIMA